MIMACALGTIATIGAVCSTDAVNAVKAGGDNDTFEMTFQVDISLSLLLAPNE